MDPLARRWRGAREGFLLKGKARAVSTVPLTVDAQPCRAREGEFPCPAGRTRTHVREKAGVKALKWTVCAAFCLQCYTRHVMGMCVYVCVCVCVCVCVYVCVCVSRVTAHIFSRGHTVTHMLA